MEVGSRLRLAEMSPRIILELLYISCNLSRHHPSRQLFVSKYRLGTDAVFPSDHHGLLLDPFEKVQRPPHGPYIDWLMKQILADERQPVQDANTGRTRVSPCGNQNPGNELASIHLPASNEAAFVSDQEHVAN